MHSFVQDLRFARRTLTADRALTALVTLTLAIGIGTATTTFGIVEAAILRQPPFLDAEQLVVAYTTRRDPVGGVQRIRWSYPRFDLLRRSAPVFEQVGSFSANSVTLTGTELPEAVGAEVVTSSYFRALRVTAARGRTFTAEEDSAPGTHPVAIVAHSLWLRRFGSDAALVGRTIGVNGALLTVVGVMPEGFAGLTGHAEVWIPAAMAPSLTYDDYLKTNQDFISVVARLRSGVELERARAEVATAAGAIQRTLPSDAGEPGVTFGATVVPLNEARVDPANRRAVLLVLGAVGFLMLLASANVANLLLGRAVSRRREIAVRLALGASRLRLVRQLLTESLVLATLGGAAGTLLAVWVMPFLFVPQRVAGPRNLFGALSEFSEPRMSAGVLAFALGLSLVATLLFGLAPALRATGIDLTADLKDGAPGSSRTAASLRSVRGFDGRGLIVIAEVALALVLLVAGGLMLKSFVRMRRVELGFDPRNVLTFSIRPSEVKYPPPTAPGLIDRVLAQIAAVPGVLAATVDGCAPLGTTCARNSLFIARAPTRPEDAPVVTRHYVAPDHFRALDIPVLRGRPFRADDRAGRPGVVIVNQTAARRFWPNDDPIGRRVWFGSGAYTTADTSAEIVGVVADTRYLPLDQGETQPSFFTPYAQFTYATRMVLVRTSGEPHRFVRAMREAVRAADPDLALYEVRTMEERLGESWAAHRFNTTLLAVFGGLAIILAATGIYGVVAHAVGQRTREMGIRIALGATSRDLIGLIVRQGMTLPLIGLVLGTAGALSLTRLLRAMLYGVSATDPSVFLAIATALGLVAVVASYVPARRATRVDPVVALRAE